MKPQHKTETLHRVKRPVSTSASRILVRANHIPFLSASSVVIIPAIAIHHRRRHLTRRPSPGPGRALGRRLAGRAVEHRRQLRPAGWGAEVAAGDVSRLPTRADRSILQLFPRTGRGLPGSAPGRWRETRRASLRGPSPVFPQPPPIRQPVAPPPPPPPPPIPFVHPVSIARALCPTHAPFRGVVCDGVGDDVVGEQRLRIRNINVHPSNC